MKNFLYFLPSLDEENQKRTFFLFETLHDGTYKSDQVGSTDRAVGIIKCALEESSRQIAIDTSTNSGRNLLQRVLPLVAEGGADKLFLASLFRKYQKEIREYWDQWDQYSSAVKQKNDEYFVPLFHSPRVQGGIRPLTDLDRLVLRVWQNARETQTDTVPVAGLVKHPVFLFLKAIPQTQYLARNQSPPDAIERLDALAAIITEQLCHLSQDPFPLADSDTYRQQCFYLFETVPLSKERMSITAPRNLVFDVVKGDMKTRDVLKKMNYPLWSLIVHMRKYLDAITGMSSINRADNGGMFRKHETFEERVLSLLDLMLSVWIEALSIHYHDGLNFVNHEVFSEKIAPIILGKCKELLKDPDVEA